MEAIGVFIRLAEFPAVHASISFYFKCAETSFSCAHLCTKNANWQRCMCV